MLDKEPMLTPQEVAQRCGVHLRTVQAWLRTKKLAGVKLGSRMWRVRESDLQRFIADRMNQPATSNES